MASCPLDPYEVVYLCCAVWLLGSAWLALLLAELGLFAAAAGAIVAAIFGAACAAAIAFALVRHGRPRAPRARAALVAAVLIAGGAFFVRDSHEFVIGGLDPGVYVNAAAQIATTGTMVWTDPDVAALSAGARRALFREDAAGLVEGSRLVGFYFDSVDQARIVPHGLHLFPALLAVAYALGGLGALFVVPPALAVVGIAGAALLARRLGGATAGGLTVLLLLVNPAETWFARYPAAELAVQAALFAGVLALAVALDLGSLAVAFAGGALLGVVHLAKIDTFVVPLAVGAVLGWLWMNRRLARPHLAFLIGYGCTAAHAVLHATLISNFYTVSVYGSRLPPPLALAGGATAALVAVAGAAWWRRRSAESTGLALAASSWRVPLLLAVSIAVLTLAAYAWYVRPLDLWGAIATSSDQLQPVVRNQLYALPRFGWYVPPLAILLAVVGLIGSLWRARGAAMALLLTVVLFEAGVVFVDPRISPEYPWAARRWVGILVPGAILFASVQIARLGGRGRLAWPGRIPAFIERAPLPAALAGLVLIGSVDASLPLLGHREYAGATALVRTIAAQTPPDAVVLFDDDLVGWRLSVPLEFLGRRASFVLFGEAGRDERVQRPLAEWDAAGRTVYWLRLSTDGTFERWGRAWRPVFQAKTDLREVANSTESPPTATRAFDVPITLYRSDMASAAP